MTSQFFTYNKNKVIQALRYHFISRKEIKTLMVVVNIFAIVSAGLFFWKKITPLAFLVSSMLWFILMIVFWFLLPRAIYKRSATFKDKFKVTLADNKFTIENEKGGRSWPWTDFSTWLESPYFFHLYFDSRSFFIIPKDAFAETDQHGVREMLSRKIKKA